MNFWKQCIESISTGAKFIPRVKTRGAISAHNKFSLLGLLQVVSNPGRKPTHLAKLLSSTFTSKQFERERAASEYLQSVTSHLGKPYFQQYKVDHWHSFVSICTIKRRNMSTKTRVEEDSTGIKQFNQRFLDSAARGDLQEVIGLLGAVDVDTKSEKGWTALMFAARNGQTAVVEVLIEKGSDINCLNASGQTALDIANFWNHTETASVLSQHRKGEEFDQIQNYYSLNPLYRASDVRKNEEALQTHLDSSTTKFVVFSNQQPFVLRSETPKKKYSFALFSKSDIPQPALDKATVIFLGLETWDPESSAWFAVDLGDNAADFANKIHPKGEFVTPFPVTMQMEPTHAGIFAEAHSVLCWLDKNRFCATCGSTTKIREGGYKRVCDNGECSSRKGIQNTSYPRVDPSLIMLVVSPDNKQCLLGRQLRFPPKMYSCLAGFMEPGECIEDTCRREVEEESGIKVGKVEYHSSQPWPFPATLMLGCIAHARTEAINIDKEELESARWFSRAELAQMLASQHPEGLFVPPAEAIAHQLIKTWVTSNSSNL